MVNYKTFSRKSFASPSAWEDLREQVRHRAQEFIATELDDATVINIAETHGTFYAFLPIGVDAYFSVTVWYRVE
jgi:hypothetical protein